MLLGRGRFGWWADTEWCIGEDCGGGDNNLTLLPSEVRGPRQYQILISFSGKYRVSKLLRIL